MLGGLISLIRVLGVPWDTPVCIFVSLTVDFLQVCLLPLHTPSIVSMYHQQLSYCVVQYVEKEAETATHILKVRAKDAQ